MFARHWRGCTPREKKAEYLEYLKRTGVKSHRATPGNLGVRVLVREDGDRAEFLVISFWDSLESIKGFAGEDIGRAVFYPEDRDYLLELSPEILHYEVYANEPAVAVGAADV